VFLFEKLRVYQKALAFAERVSALTAQLPRTGWHLADQLNRASLSIALNIAESSGRRTSADRGNFLDIARGSVHECVPLVEICRRRRLIGDAICAELVAELEDIAKMLSGLIERTRGEPTR
jgi:four helix bundle protein